MIGVPVNQEEELLNFLSELRDKGFDVSEDSNIVQILETIIGSHVENRNQIKEILDSLTFENRSGKLLDELYNFFGIPRLVKTISGASFKIRNSGYPYNVITIKDNTLLEYKNNLYRVTTEHIIRGGETKEVFCYPVNYVVPIKDYLQVGDFKFQSNKISVGYANTDYEVNEFFKNNVLINDFKINTDKESDLEYKSRANGLIQNFGFNNIEKIKNYIMGIEHVYNVYVEKEFCRQRIIIVPDDINYLEQILDQANECVDFYCTSPMIVQRPSITTINISGITKQLAEWFGSEITSIDHLNNIAVYLREYCKNVYTKDDKVISRDSIEFTINKYFVDNDIQFSLNEKELKINYFIYTDEDYKEPIITNELDSRQKKEIKTDIVILGDVI